MVLRFVVVSFWDTSKWNKVKPLVRSSSSPDLSFDVGLVNRVQLKSIKPLIGFGLEGVLIGSG